MLKLVVLAICMFSALANAQSASISLETRILNIPVLEVIDGESTQYAEVELQASEDFSAFSLVGGVFIDSPSTINFSSLDGSFDGEAKLFSPGTNIALTAAQSCALESFNPSSNTTTISTTSNSIEIEQESFFNGTCELSGELVDGTLSGTFQCSNFNSGSWSASQLEVLNDNLLVAIISMDGDDCDYDMHLTGYKE